MNSAPSKPSIGDAYKRYTLTSSIRNSKVACILVAILMPLGYVMDHFVYPPVSMYFLVLRLMSSAMAILLLILLRQPRLSDQHSRILCTGWYLIPAFFICCMIKATDGVSSTYYAGLNLVILAVSSVIQATLIESMVAVCGIVAMYVVACVWGQETADWRMVANNSFFIFCTAAIVITGNYFYNRLRFREFTLRHELDENRQQLEDSNRKLKELDEAKGRFFANISHELRTPLTLLLAPLETLINRFGRGFDIETRELMATMQANGMRLLKLINDLLDLVRLESGHIGVRNEPMEVADFVKGLASAVRQVANDKRIHLETKVDPELTWIQADRDKLEKIVLNLLFNALKFTPAGGRVSLSADKAGEHYVIKVQDTGMGISKKNLANIFSRFWQADDSSRRKYQGVGIGLALVKELTDVQGGNASVDSEEGKGTTFIIELPYLEAQPLEKTPALPAASAPASGTATSDEWLSNLYRRAELFPAMTAVQQSVRQVETTRNGNVPRALIADDEPDMLRFLKSQLSGHYQILEAVDGQQAVDKASQFLPDVILMDMMMPEKDGLQACKELRERTSTQAIPIIILTARADEDTKLAALSAGASDFLPKPFSTTELHVRVKNLVESYHFQRKLSKQNLLLEETIEQLKETETQLVETEKLASLGRMSAGIIHEINNPLNFAATGLFTLKRKAKFIPEAEQAEYVEILSDVEEGLTRVKNIVSDLRSFSHHENEAMEQVDVAELVTSTLRFLSHETRGRVEMEQKLAENQTVWGNKNKLIQVAVNLLQNALDALKTKQFSAPEKPTIWIEGRVEEGKSLLIFRDNGPGIVAENMDKIFDPFFTTKDVGEGVGLGLSICYRIVRNYDGRILVRTEPGKFCEFTLEFPVKGQA
jgi:signal transduction histidine kinase